MVKVVDPRDGVASTGFFVNQHGFLLTCWHVLEPGFCGVVREWMWVEYRGEQYKARLREDLSNRNKDIAVLQVEPAWLTTLQQSGFEAAPLRLSWRFSGAPCRVEADPVAALGFETQLVTGGQSPAEAKAPRVRQTHPVLVRGYVDPDNTPASLDLTDCCGEVFAHQECVQFTCDRVDVDYGLSGGPLCNLLSGCVEGIVAGVPESGAVAQATGIRRSHPFGFAIPLADVEACWPGFVRECGVKTGPVEINTEIIRQEKELIRHWEFTDRPEWAQRVEDFLSDPNRRSGYLVLVGGPGEGKSGFVAHSIQERVAPIYHFLRRDEPGWDDPELMLRSLAAQFRLKYGVDAQPLLLQRLDEAASPAERNHCAAAVLADIIERVGHIVLAEGRKEVLWLDGLDEAFGPMGRFRDTPGLPGLLPAQLPPGIFAVLTSRPGDHLGWLRDRRFCVLLSLEDERGGNIEDAERYFRDHAAEVTPPLSEDFCRRAARKTQGNFYLATRILDEIRGNPTAPRDPDRLPGTVKDFHERTLTGIKSRASDGGISEAEVEELLGLLAVAREPLSLEHLQSFGAPKSAERLLDLTAAWFELRPVHRDPQRPYVFNHTSVPEFLDDRMTAPERREGHARLARACAGWRELRGSPRTYALNHRLAHLIAAEQWEEFAKVFADADFIVERGQRSGFGPVHSDVLSAFQTPEIPAEWRQPMEELEKFVRCRIRRLGSFPLAYPQEVVNEFLPTACSQWHEAMACLKAVLVDRRKPLFRKVSGPDALSPAGHTGPVNRVVFSPDGQRVVSASWDGTVKAWETETGHLIADFDVRLTTGFGQIGMVQNPAVSADGEMIAVGSGRTVQVLEARTGLFVAECVGHMAPVRCVAFSPDGRRLVSASDDSTVRLWEARTGQAIGVLDAHSMLHQERGPSHSCTDHVAFSADGETVVAASLDGGVRVWNVGNLLLRCCHLLVGSRRAGPFDQVDSRLCVSVSVVNRYVVFGTEKGRVELWCLDTGRKSTEWVAHSSGVFGVAVSPCGDSIATAGADRAVRVWEVASALAIAEFLQHKGYPKCVAFSPDRRLVASGGLGSSVQIWEVATGRVITTIPGHMRAGLNVAFSSDGNGVARETAVDGERAVEVLEMETGKVVSRLFQGHASWITSIAVSPDAKLVAVGDSSGHVRLWQTQTAQLVACFPVDDKPVVAVAFSPDGRWVASAGRSRRVKVWEWPTGQLVADLAVEMDERALVRAVAFSPDGRRLATAEDTFAHEGGGDRVKVWEPSTGRLLVEPLPCVQDGVFAVAFSQDCRRVATGGRDGTVKVWDAETGTLIADCQGHQSRVRSVAFSSDGRWVASGGDDRTVKVWDAQSGDCVNSLFFSLRPAAALFVPKDLPHLQVADELGRVFGYEVHDRPGVERTPRASQT